MKNMFCNLETGVCSPIEAEEKEGLIELELINVNNKELEEKEPKK